MLAELRLHAGRHIHQKGVARRLPEAFVDATQVFDADEEQRDGRSEHPCTLLGLGDAVLQQAAVRKIRDRVIEGASFQHVLGQPTLGHVRQARDDLSHAAVVAQDRHRVDEQPADGAVRRDGAHHDISDGFVEALRDHAREFVVGHRRSIFAKARALRQDAVSEEPRGGSGKDPPRSGVRKHDRASCVVHHDGGGDRVVDRGKVAPLSHILPSLSLLLDRGHPQAGPPTNCCLSCWSGCPSRARSGSPSRPSASRCSSPARRRSAARVTHPTSRGLRCPRRPPSSRASGPAR